MTRLADIRARLEALTAQAWHTARCRPGGTWVCDNANRAGGHMISEQDTDFVAHARGDMRVLLDAWDFVLDGKPIRYVMAQLDEITEELETAGDHSMAQTLSRLAVGLGRLG